MRGMAEERRQEIVERLLRALDVLGEPATMSIVRVFSAVLRGRYGEASRELEGLRRSLQHALDIVVDVQIEIDRMRGDRHGAIMGAPRGP